MQAVKRVIRKSLLLSGYELCHLTDHEAEGLPGNRSLSYKEAQCYRALGNLGQLSIQECQLLGELIRRTDIQRPIIEIGTLFGFSTLVISMFKCQEQELITVDNYSWNPLGIDPDVHFQITRNRLSEVVASHKVRVVRMDKNEFYRTYQGPPPALFFCDADHSYEATKKDILWARSVGASVICGDDYDLPSEPGVKRAVDEFGGPVALVDGLFVL